MPGHSYKGSGVTQGGDVGLQRPTAYMVNTTTIGWTWTYPNPFSFERQRSNDGGKTWLNQSSVSGSTRSTSATVGALTRIGVVLVSGASVTNPSNAIQF